MFLISLVFHAVAQKYSELQFLKNYTDPPGAPSSLPPRPALLRATRTNMAARASVVVAAAAVSASGLKAFGLTV